MGPLPDGSAGSCGRTEWRDSLLARGTEEGFLGDMEYELVLDGKPNSVSQGKAVQVEEKDRSRSREVGEHGTLWRMSDVVHTRRKVVRGVHGNCLKCGQNVGYIGETVRDGPE